MCGLAGIISTEKTKFNVNHFNILGTLNDERGGDSCGIFIDGIADYGIGDNAMFRTFTVHKEYPSEASIALVHCRKASYGMLMSIEQAHPIVFKDEYGNVEFVVMHNGTIENARELATKYCPELNVFGKSDTQIMAHIMYKKGYDVLEEYKGTAVFIIVDYRQIQTTVMLFKGSSVYNEAKTKSERPLYCAVKDNKFYFSSIYHSLYCIDHTMQICNVPTNQLVIVNGTELLLYRTIDRSKISKVKAAVTQNMWLNNSSNITYDTTKNLYMIGNNVAHGEYKAYPSGYITSHKSPTSYTYYFYAGRLLYNKDCYELLSDVASLFPTTRIEVYFPEIIDYFAYGCRLCKTNYLQVNDDFQYVAVVDKIWSTLFTNTAQHEIKNSEYKKIFVYPLNANEIFANACKNTTFNLSEIESKIYRYIYNNLDIYDDL